MVDERPNPDELLQKIQRQEEKACRGRLKVFFGAAAGVGKTYAMLGEARELRAQGVDVVAGLVETHGRAETEALLEGLERLPRRTMAYRGAHLQEFDLDAALKRHPSLILVDELAHTNVEGSRHPEFLPQREPHRTARARAPAHRRSGRCPDARVSRNRIDCAHLASQRTAYRLYRRRWPSRTDCKGWPAARKRP